MNATSKFRLRAGWLFLLALASALAATGAESSGYLGSDKCKTCHSDVAFNFYKNPHSGIRPTAKDPQEAVACESCHGPGKAHVDARGCAWR